MTETPPIQFKRGQTFSYLAQIPSTLSAGFLSGWSVKAQLRKTRTTAPSGLIANIFCKWVNADSLVLLLHNNLTQNWPFGLADLAVRFESPTGQSIESKTITFDIIQGVTQ